MKRQAYFLNKYRPEDSSDESDDYSDHGLNAPKRSPMRRKEKFRNKDKNTEGKHKDRKRGYRNKIQYDFALWEE